MRPEQITPCTNLQAQELNPKTGKPISNPKPCTVVEKPLSFNPKISQAKLEKILPLICDRETSLDAGGWKAENPLWGHCAVVSLVAQNIFGGELMRGSLEDYPDFKHMRSHYWNKLSDGSEVDFTKPQFGEKYPIGMKGAPRERAYVLSFEETLKRYKLLSLRLAKHLSGNNPIFDDPIYQKCFLKALESPCQKMKFGCVITRGQEIVYEGANNTIAPLKELCDPKCIRFLIQSRTEQMLGACGHAEELGLWEVSKKGIPLEECELYVAGTYPDGSPWLKEEAVHTCLRCATQMYNAGIKKVHVPVKDKWEALTSEEAVKTAIAYATKEKVPNS